MPTHLKKESENGGNVSQSELKRNGGLGCWPEDAGWREGRGGGKGNVVVDSWYRWVFVM